MKSVNTKVMNEISEHAKAVDKYCKEHGLTRIFTALYGSQNYGLANDDSDVDTKSIIVPYTSDWLWSTENDYNHLIEMNNGGHAEIKSIVAMFKQFIKGNINFLEILSTPYVDVAPNWDWFYTRLTDNKNEIIEHNKYKQASVWLGYISQMLHRATHSNKESKFLIDNPFVDTTGYNYILDYNPKALINAIRIKESFIKYFQLNQHFEEAIDVSNRRNELLAIKAGSLPTDQALMMIDEIEEWIIKAKAYIELHYTDMEIFNAENYLKGITAQAFAAKSFIEKGLI